MEAKTKFIQKLADTLVKKGKQMKYAELANELNKKGFLTTRGYSFNVGGRGIAKLVSAVWYRLDEQGLTGDRNNVEVSFTDENGQLPHYQ